MQLLISYLAISEIDTSYSGDVKENLGPKKEFYTTFSISHWNINSLVVHNFTNVALLITYLLFKGSTSSTYLNLPELYYCRVC